MRYDNIIWDFDGTLFDTYPAMCRDLRLTMERLGFFFTGEELLERFTVSRGAVLAYCAERTGMTAQEVDKVYRAWVAEHGRLRRIPFRECRNFWPGSRQRAGETSSSPTAAAPSTTIWPARG